MRRMRTDAISHTMVGIARIRLYNVDVIQTRLASLVEALIRGLAGEGGVRRSSPPASHPPCLPRSHRFLLYCIPSDDPG